MRKLKGLRRVLAAMLVICLTMGMFTMPAMATGDTPTQVVYEGGTLYYDKTGEVVDADKLGEAGAVVGLSKELEPTELENEFDITLTVETTLKQEETYENTIPVYYDSAVVLTIDMSGTMYNNKMDGKRYVEVAKATALDFLKKYSESAKHGEVRNLAVVAFDTDATVKLGWTNVTGAAGYDEAKKAILGIQVADNGNTSSKRVCTNFDGGLMLTRNLLNVSAIDKEHSWSIILSDGAPTVTSENSTGLEIIKSTFWGDQKDTNGVTYQSKHQGGGWTHPAEVRNNLTYLTQVAGKSKVYMVGVGGLMNVKLFHDACYGTANGGRTPDVKNKPQAFNGITPAIDVNNMTTEGWMTALANAVGGSYIPANNTNKLNEAFNTILGAIGAGTKGEEVVVPATGWNSVDPIGGEQDTPCVGFLGFFSDKDGYMAGSKAIAQNPDGDTASYEDNIINWDLKKSDYTEKDGVFTYSIKYRARLENEKAAFVEEKPYVTNGTTTLSFTTWNPEKKEYEEAKDIFFPIPKVKGWLAELTFMKVDDAGTPLAGATFKLVHKADCECHDVVIADKTGSSDANGTVRIANIPSGHTYELTETNAPANHEKSDKIYDVTVSTGKITVVGVNEDTLVVVNDRMPGNLEVSKTVVGPEEETGIKFAFTVTLDNEEINGTYGDMTFVNGVAAFELGDGEKKAATGLPAGIGYTVTEENGDYANTERIGDNGVIPANGTVYAAFVNTKNIGEFNLVATKALEGAVLAEGQFEFVLLDASGAVLQTKKNAVDGTVIFDAIQYVNAGVYTYLVEEVIPEDADKFMTYDESKYQVTVTVTTAENGDLVADAVIVKGNEAAEQAAFVNVYQELGGLTVTKKVEGELASADDAFPFTVTLSDASVNGTYGDMTFVNGVAAFTLKHGESMTATGLPAGITYQVTENPMGYLETSTGAAGVIPADAQALAAFVNVLEEDEVLGDQDSPGTADDNGGLWLGVSMVSVIALAVVHVSRRKYLR